MKLEETFDEMSDVHVCEDPLEAPKESHSDSDQSFCFETKEGRKYSPAIRKLYYYLLSAEIPPPKIASIVREALSSFFPMVDVSTLKLPREVI